MHTQRSSLSPPQRPRLNHQGPGFSSGPVSWTPAPDPGLSYASMAAHNHQQPPHHHVQTMAPQYAQQMPQPQGHSAPRHSGASNGHAADGHDDDDDDGQGKRRRVQRACDVCRKKKIRCDGLQPEKGSCSNCATYGHQCTFVDAAKKRAPPRSYVDALEARMERMEKLLVTLAPGVDFTDRIGPPVRLPGEEDKDGGHGRDASGGLPTSLRLAGLEQPSGSGSNPASDEAESDDDHITFIVDDLRAAKLEEQSAAAHDRDASGNADCLSRGNSLHASDSPASGASNNRDDGSRIAQSFIGMASDLHLISMLDRINNRREASSTGTDIYSIPTLNTSLDLLKARGAGKARAAPPLGGGEGGVDVESLKLPWPPADLEELLLDTYFRYCHAEYPILNEVVFRQEARERPELRLDPAWASIAFTVFALASRYTDDPRVIDPERAPNTTRNDSQATAGFDFWLQRRRLQIAMRFSEVNIHVVQCIIIGTIYMLFSCSSITVPWAMLGVAVRMLEEIGAHRKVTAAKLGFPLVTEETFRRLWWTVYSLDRDMSSGLGRPMAIHDEDFDVDPPLPIDDAVIYSASLNEATPVQPEDKPSRIAAFACLTQLDQIIGRTLRTIYAIGKAKMKRGFVGAQWDLFILTEIDSALNHWLSTVPAHLRYDPNEPDEQTLILSSQIYARYYQAQILLHRSFLPSPYSRSKENFPSLAICTNAARSISHVIWNLHKRGLVLRGAFSLAFRAFTAGCMLLIVVWAAKQNGSVTSPSTIADIHKCVDVLEAMAQRSYTAERFHTTLRVLLKSSDIKPLEVERGTKRNVEGGAAGDAAFNNAHVGGAGIDDVMSDRTNRPQATSRRALAASESSQRIVTSLPFSTTELAAAFASNTTSPRSQTSAHGSPHGSNPSPARSHAPHPSQHQQAQHFQPAFHTTPPMPSASGMGAGAIPMGLQTPRQGVPSWDAAFAAERGMAPSGWNGGQPGAGDAGPSFAYLFSDPSLAGPLGLPSGGAGGATTLAGGGLTPGSLPPSFFANLTPGLGMGGAGGGGDMDMTSAFNFGNANELGFDAGPAPAGDPARGLAHAGGVGSGGTGYNPMATTPSDPLESLYAQRNLGWEPPEWLNRMP